MECTSDDKWNCKYCRKVESCEANKAGSTARPPTPTGWSDTDWLKHLQEQQHPLAGLHINQGSMDAAADAYEAEYNARHNIGIVIAMGIVGQSDFEEEQRQADQYCEMVKLWKETRGQAGWPAYNGEGNCPKGDGNK